MARTTFSGPVKSDNGFEGDITGNATLVNLTVTGDSALGNAATDKVGFYGATTIVQYDTTGTVTGFVAGSGTAAKDDSTFTGNTGTTAYTVGDIVRALKQLGLIKA